MADRLALLRDMLRIRRLEEAVARLAQQPELIHSGIHLYIGQEATGVGACAALQPGDYVFTTHRNHGHVLARGGDPRRILAEILGRSDGYCGGRGGSFHVAAPQLGILHTSAIVGGCLPLAAGAAFAAQHLGTQRIALVFFGDGAMDEGVASETFSIAQAWHLPVVFIMEHNSPKPSLAAVPRAYGLPTETVDGTDVDAVAAVAHQAVQHARGQGSPFFVESRTPPWPGGPELDLSSALAQAPPSTADPIVRCARSLLDHAQLTREQLQTLDQAVRSELQAAVDFALGSPEPDPASLGVVPA